MALIGQVTKVGFMNKTATVTVSRFIFHPKTGKVRPPQLYAFVLVFRRQQGLKGYGTKRLT